MHQAVFLVVHCLLEFFESGFKFRQFSVLELGCLLQIVIALCGFDLFIDFLDFLTHFGDLGDRCFLIIPARLFDLKILLQLGQLFLERFQPLLAQMVFLLLEGRHLDLSLHNLALLFIHLSRHGIQFRLD